MYVSFRIGVGNAAMLNQPACVSNLALALRFVITNAN
jgi:hypothetical protein